MNDELQVNIQAQGCKLGLFQAPLFGGDPCQRPAGPCSASAIWLVGVDGGETTLAAACTRRGASGSAG